MDNEQPDMNGVPAMNMRYARAPVMASPRVTGNHRQNNAEAAVHSPLSIPNSPLSSQLFPLPTHFISSGFSLMLPHSRSDQMKPALKAGSSVTTKRLTSTMVS